MVLSFSLGYIVPTRLQTIVELCIWPAACFFPACCRILFFLKNQKGKNLLRLSQKSKKMEERSFACAAVLPDQQG